MAEFDLAAYQAEYQRQQAQIKAANDAALAAAQKTGISNINRYDNTIGGADIIPGMSAEILSGLGMYNPQYAAIMRTYGSANDKSDETNVTERSTFAVDPNAEYRLVDAKGNVIGSTETGASVRSLVDAANALSEKQGKNAAWSLQAATPGGSYNEVASDSPDTTVGDFAKQVLNTAAQIGIAAATGGASIPAQIAAQAGTAATLTLAEGGNLKQAITAGVMAAAPVVGKEFLGPMINTGLDTGAKIVGSSLGAGIGAVAAGALTGQNLGQMIQSGIAAGATTYMAPDIAKAFKGVVGTTSGGGTSGGASGDIIVTGTPVGAVSGSLSAPKTTQVVDKDGNIIVTAKGVGAAGGLPSSAFNYDQFTVPSDIADLAKLSNDGSDIFVTGSQTGGVGGGVYTPPGENIDVTAKKETGGTGGGSSTKYTPPGENIDVTAKKDTGGTGGDSSTKYTPPGENIDVTAKKDTGGTGGDSSTKYTPPGENIDVTAPKDTWVGPPIYIPPVISDPWEPPTPPGDKKKWTWKDWARIALLAPSVIKGLGAIVGTGDDTTTITSDQSSVKFNPLSRERGIGTFDPFTYGQAGPGYQTAEFEFFKPYSAAQPVQTSTPSKVVTTPGAPIYQYTQEQVDALNKAAADKYAADTASFNAYQDALAQQVEAGGISLNDAIAKANAFGATLGGVAPVTAADGGLIEYRKGGKAKREKLTYADLSPEEKNAVDYHRRNMAADMVRRNDDGSGSSYIGVINELNGKETYYPTFWNGRELPREEAEKRVRQSGIAFPTYPDYETGLKRERQIHDDIMAPEMSRYLKGDRSFLEGYADGGEMSDDMVNHLIAYRKNGGHEGPGRVKGIGSGQEDKIPAWLSDGEYVWSAQDVADLGDGSTDEGVRRLDKMREMVRKQAGRKDVKKIAKPQQGIDKMLNAVGGKV